MLTILHYTYTQASVALDSPTLAADARCSLGCIHLSCILFAGSLLYKLVTAAWFVDPIVAIGKVYMHSLQPFVHIALCCMALDTL
jgi:hypothetical protein